MRGRIRLRIPLLKESAPRAVQIASWFEGQRGVCSLRVNRACASIVICYTDRAPDSLAPILGALQDLTVAGLGRAGLSLQTAPKTSSEGQPLRWATLSLALCIVGGPAAYAAVPLVIWGARSIWAKALTTLIREHRLNVDFLDGLCILISLVRAQFGTASFIVWMIGLGDWMRDRTAAKSKRAFKDLLSFQTQLAWVHREGKLARIPASEVAVGDRVTIYPGDMIPVDGKVAEGAAMVDQKTITGESLPVQRGSGDRVYAATVVRDGKLTVDATGVGENTTAAQIVHLLETAPMGETRMQNYAERFADRLVAPWLAATGAIFAVTANVDRLVSMIIIDYGTGIRVAAPTSVLAAMTAAARRGILIKSGAHMEKLARVDTIVFDKTGTLTRGQPEIYPVIPYSKHFPERKALALAASAEQRLKHPIAEAIVAKARQERVRVPPRSASAYQVGRGIEARVNGSVVHVGSTHYFRERSICFERAQTDIRDLNERGRSTLLLAVDGALAGVIPFADQVRAESPLILKALHELGVKRTIMLTGDSARVARAVARDLGIDQFFADTLPADKAEIIQALQKEGRTVAMVGDGINDSPALSYADVGIAMKNGADVAREAADVVLMEDSLWKLLGAIEISREAISTVKQNFGIIAGLNTLAFLLAIPPGLVSPGITALISNGSAILASLNGMRPFLTD